MKLSAIKKSVADGAGVTGQTLIYDSAVSTGSNTYLPTGLYGDSIEGTYAFTTNQDRLYLHTGQGWFQVSTINTNPTFTTGLNASYSLATDATAYKNGTATNIEVLATDPEGFDVTYTATGDTAFNNIAHIERTAGHDSAKGRFFTIEPKTQDSAGSAAPADGVLTITASDGINTASTTGTFSLLFDTTIAGSEGTTFLSKGIGTGGDNSSFSDKSTTGTTHTITAVGDTYQGTFSPYSPARYSWRFPGHTENGGIQTDTSGPTLGNGTNFTVEFWFKNDYEFNTTSDTDGTYGYQTLVSDSLYGNGTNNGGWALYQRQDEIRLAVNNASKLQHHYGPWIATHSKWNHVAWVRNSGTSKIYINGYDGGVSVSDTVNYVDNKICIGANNTSGQFPRYEYKGWIHDLRIVVGTPVYTGNFTPPDGPLTTTGGSYPSTTNVNTSITASHTKYQACNLPYIYGKGSTGDAIHTVNGAVISDAFSPYKVQALYSSSTHGGSAYMNGSSDNLSITGSSDFDLLAPSGTSNNFTIEMWLYKTVGTSGGEYDGLLWWSNTDRLKFQASNSIINFEIDDTELTIVNGTHSFMNRWVHLAIVREGTNIKTYVNGVLQTTHNNSGTPGGTGTLNIGGNGFGTSQVDYFGGFITDLRIVKGTAVYTGNFTPPTSPLTEVSNTKLLLSMTDGKVIDAGGRQNLRLYGDAQSHSGQPRVSGLSGILLDGNGDVAYFNPKRGYIMDKNEDYTVEFYTYYNATPAKTNNINPVFYNAIGYGTSATYDEAYINTTSSNALTYVHSGEPTSNADTNLANSQSVSNTGSFIHVAVVKKDQRLQTFVNGNPGTNFSVAHTEPFGRTGEGFVLGAYHSTGGWINAYISEFRITRGQGRYPFLPKKETLTTTTSFQDGITLTASNTKLLTAHAATITDGSSTGHTVSTVGSPSVSDFAPIGGMKSIYAANGESHLTVAGHSDFAFGTGDFTIEFWYYTDQASNWPAGTHPFDLQGNVSVDNSNNMRMFIGFGSGTVTLRAAGGNRIQSDYEIQRYKWEHIAVSRQSGSTRMFINGTVQSTTYSDTNNYTGEDMRIGSRANTSSTDYGLYGYISNFRIVKGQALYTKNFTPPATEITG